LSVGGHLGGTMTLASGGRLQGVGTVGAVSVQSGATVAPGNSIGTLATGSILFAAGSIFEVEVDAAGNGDRIASSGTATINGGTVAVLAGAGNYARGTDYTILTAANGVTGTGFTGVTSNLAFLTPTLHQTADSVVLTLTRNDVDFAAIGGTFNQRSAGHALDALGGGTIYDAVVQLDAPGARAAFDAVSGEIHPSLRTALVEDGRLPREAVLRRLSGDASGGLNAWAEGFGNWGQSDGDGNAARMHRDTSGFVTGIDIAAGANWRLGVAGGYTRTELHIGARNSSGTADQVHGLAYAGGAYGPVRIRVGAGYAHADLATSRSAAFAGFSDGLNADYSGSIVQGFGEVGYRVPLGGGHVEPFAGAAAARAKTGGFTERGGPAALTGSSASDTRIESTVGLRGTTAAAGPVSLNATLAWQHGYRVAPPLSPLRFPGGDAFLIAGAPLSRDSAVADIGVTWRLAPALSLAATYSGVLGDRGQDHAAKAGLQLAF
jgi:outer membrane autotransporter protein